MMNYCNSNLGHFFCSGYTIHGNFNTVIGDNNIVYGDNNKIRGHKNTMYGSNGHIMGNDNIIFGDTALCNAVGMRNTFPDCLQNNANPPVIRNKRPRKRAEKSPPPVIEKTKCVVCMENDANLINVPCSHQSYCGECFNRGHCIGSKVVKECAICRTSLEGVNEVVY